MTTKRAAAYNSALNQAGRTEVQSAVVHWSTVVWARRISNQQFTTLD